VDIFNIKSTRKYFQVNLQLNNLTTLPEGIFDMAIKSSGTVRVYLQNNNWHCDCGLAWLRNYMDKEIIDVVDKPMCISPEINKNKSLRDADFSDCNITTLPSDSSTTTTEAITSSTTETVTSESNTPSTVETTVDSATSTTETTSDTTTLHTQDNNTTALSTQDTDNTITLSTELSTETTSSTTGDTDNTIASSTDVTTDATSSTTGHTDNTITSSTEVTTDTTSSTTGDTDSTFTSTELTTDTTSSTTGDTDNTIISPTELTTDSTTSSTEEGNTELRCSCTTCSSEDIYEYKVTETSIEMSPLIMTGIKIFKIDEDDKTGAITATVECGSNHALIWMKNSESNNTDCNYSHFNAAKQGSSRHTTFATKPNTPYIICVARIISHEEITVPPLNCRAYTTLPIPEDRPLILIKDKYTTLAISCSALLIILIASGVISYKVLLYNPIFVEHKNSPQNGENDNPRSSQSTCSTISTGEGTYVTLKQTNVEQTACKFTEICDIPSDCKT
jgi:hypothetical protein